MVNDGSNPSEYERDQISNNQMLTPTFYIPYPSQIVLTGSKNVLHEIRYFRQQWRFYCVAAGITEADECVKVANLHLAIGKEANEVIHNELNLTEAGKNNSECILKALEDHFYPKINVVYMRYLFNQLTQDEQENIDAYVLRLKQLGNLCDYKEHTENIIRDRFVVGLKDETLKSELLRDMELTLKRAIAVSKAAEANDYFREPCLRIPKLMAIGDDDSKKFELFGGRKRPSK